MSPDFGHVLTDALHTELDEIEASTRKLRAGLLRVVAHLHAHGQTQTASDIAPHTMSLAAAQNGPLCDVCERPRVACMGCHDEPPSLPPAA